MVMIKTADLTQDFKRYADRIVRGERVMISRPRNENLVVITEREYNEFESLREKEARAELGRVIREIQEDSVKNGTDKMSMDDIDAIIKESRAERRAKK